jgi:hypothetical protein
MHFIVAWPVIVAAATNYVSHNGNHTGSVAPQAATVVVAARHNIKGDITVHMVNIHMFAGFLRISLAALDDFSLIFSCAYCMYLSCLP